MKVRQSSLPGVLLVEPCVFADDRGCLSETWNSARYAAHGIPAEMVQDNLSISRQGVLRGLHYQNPHSQGKLVYVLEGTIFDVAVDIRVGSPTFRCWVGIELASKHPQQVYVPPGFAHGFCVLSPTATVAYKCTSHYCPEAEAGVRWNDPEIGIDWPIRQPLLSSKDQLNPLLSEISLEQLPRFSEVALFG